MTQALSHLETLTVEQLVDMRSALAAAIRPDEQEGTEKLVSLIVQVNDAINRRNR